MPFSKASRFQIVKELAKLFVEQGWIAQEQVDKLFWDRQAMGYQHLQNTLKAIALTVRYVAAAQRDDRTGE